MAKAKIKEMKALSIAQPWPECILNKGKNVENRDWSTKRRGYFAIHASAGLSKYRFESCYDNYRIKLDPEKLDYGAIVGFAEVVDVITKREVTKKTKKWFQGDYGFVLKNIIKLKKPVPVKGMLLFWTLKGRPLRAALNQLNSRQKKKILKKLL